MKSIRISGISSICKCVGLNWGIVRIIGKYDGSAEDEKNAARRMENEENEELRTRKTVNRRLRLTARLVNALNSHQLPNRSHRNIGKIQKPNDTIPKDTNNMHRLPWKWAWLPLLLLITAKLEQVGGKTYLDWARTDSQLTRLPFFGGGVGHLLRYLHPLSMSPPSERGKISELRSELDANYVSYRGAQLWKLNFNATRGSSMAEREEDDEAAEERQVLASPDAQFNEVVALFGESKHIPRRVYQEVCRSTQKKRNCQA